MLRAVLTTENYNRGFLVDEEYLAGVSEDPETPGQYMSFLVDQGSGEVVAVEKFSDLPSALESSNSWPRDFVFEGSGCGGNCAAGGCKSSEGCSAKNSAQGSCGC